MPGRRGQPCMRTVLQLCDEGYVVRMWCTTLASQYVVHAGTARLAGHRADVQVWLHHSAGGLELRMRSVPIWTIHVDSAKKNLTLISPAANTTEHSLVHATLAFEAYEVMSTGEKTDELRANTEQNRSKFVVGRKVRFTFGRSKFNGQLHWFECWIVQVAEILGTSFEAPSFHRAYSTGFTAQVWGDYLHVSLGPIVTDSADSIGFPRSVWLEVVQERTARTGRRNVCFDARNVKTPVLWTRAVLSAR
jgi:hypothetical protein